jgi:hypothetical protein
LNVVWDLVQAVSDWPGIAMMPTDTGLSLSLSGVKLGVLRWNGRLDSPFEPDVGDQLVAEQMASRDPNQRDTTRVVFDIRTAADVDRAIWLLRLVYLSAHAKVDVCGIDGIKGRFPGIARNESD